MATIKKVLKVALVTGASRGIGQAIIQQLAQQGFWVAGTATTAKGVTAIEHSITEVNGQGKGYVMDVNDEQAIAKTLVAINAESLFPQVLVNNAGITQDALLMRMTDQQWDQVIETDLKSVYRLSKACIKEMARNRFGRIVNISSIVATLGNAGQSNYAAAKAGIEGFSRALAREVASRNITVNCVAPGFIASDMTDKLTEVQRQALLQQIPMARLGQPAEIASAVAFLVSDAAAFITGETLHVNGGMSMH